MVKIMKKFMVRKLLFNLWKQLGGCVACEYEKEQEKQVDRAQHRCSESHDARIQVKIK